VTKKKIKNMDTFSAWQLGRLAGWAAGGFAARQSSGLGLANQFSGKKLFSVSFFFSAKAGKKF
jgi:hypothetical protein